MKSTNQLQRVLAAVEISEKQISQAAVKPTQQMCQLLVAGEDHRFNLHYGIDPIAMCRAAWKTLRHGERQGGSTIAMQLVRTITGRYERTWSRKLSEVFLAVRLTWRIGRDRLPAVYLWLGYYGWRMNDFRQACSRLGFDPTRTEVEAAKLVARLKYPEPRLANPVRKRQIRERAEHLINLKNRQKTALLPMGPNGTIHSTHATEHTQRAVP